MLEALAGTASDDGSRLESTVAELARSTGRDKSIVSRQLRALVDLGLVERGEDGRHRLGWRLFTLAARAGDQRLLLLAPAVMRRLSDVTGERVHLSVLAGGKVLTILSEGSQQLIQTIGLVGRTSPIHCTSSGRALLFDHSDDDVRGLFDGADGPGPRAPRTIDELLHRLHQARTRGFALADGETEAELVAAAAPVRDFRGRIVAALNVSAPAYRLRDRLPSVGQQVAAAAAHLSRVTNSGPAVSN
jgi:IclR family transcriptional regulator, KDG regulon repressor